MKRFLTETIILDSRGSTPWKFKPSQLLAEIEAEDDEGPNTSKQRSPTLPSDDDILDKVRIGKRRLFTAPLDENSDNESARQPKPPTMPTESNENEEAVIPRDKDLKRSTRSLSINLRLLQFANTLVFVLLCC